MLYNNIGHKIQLLFFIYLTLIASAVAQPSNADQLKLTYKKIDVLMEQEALDSVVHYYQQALQLATETKDSSFILSETAYIYALLEDYEASVHYFKKALDFALLRTPDDTTFIADQYYYVAYCFDEMEDYNQSLEYYKRSLAMPSDNPYSFAVAETLSSMASTYFHKSDYDNAIDYEQQALSILEQKKDAALIAESKNGLGLYHYFKQDYEKALPYVQSAVDTFEEIMADSVAENTILAYHNLALVLIKLKQLNLAQAYLNKAFKIHQERAIKRRYEITLFNQAFLYYESGKEERALKMFKETIDLYTEKYPDGHSNMGKAYYYMGKISEDVRDVNQALQYYQKSLNILVPEFEESALERNPDLKSYCRSRRNLLRSLVAKANALSQQYQLQKNDVGVRDLVFETYDLAVATVQQLRESYRSEGSKYFLAEETQTLYAGAIAFVYQLYADTDDEQFLERAFYFMEKNQTPILLQNQLAIEGQVRGGVPAEILDVEKQTSIELSFFENQLALAKIEKDDNKIKRYSEYVIKFKRELDALRENLETNYPRYYEYQYQSATATVAELRKVLTADQLFMQYHQVGDQLFLLSVNQKQVDLKLLKDVEAIGASVRALLKTLQNPLTKKLSERKGLERFVEHSNMLYQLLLEQPLGDDLSTVKRLAISTNGILSELPFEVLLNDKAKSENTGYLSLPYLLNDYAISYQPSASLMLRLHTQDNQPIHNKVLALAPYSQADAQLKTAFTRSYLGNLPYTKEEIENIQKHYRTIALSQEAARKNTFLQQAAQYQILHLATHGVADFTNPANAHLLFYPDNPTSPQDHILYNYEVQNTELNAELVVLSACETGAGKIDVGEGVLSLARGFFYTGVPAVIMSKWQINDQSSSLIISELYNGFSQAKNKDQALQLAKINYLEKQADQITAHPFYWAGLVQIGNTKPLSSSSYSVWYYSLFLIVLLFVFYLIKLRIPS